MRIKIIEMCSEEELNEILKDMEDHKMRIIDNIIFKGENICILSHHDNSVDIKDIFSEEKIRFLGKGK